MHITNWDCFFLEMQFEYNSNTILRKSVEIIWLHTPHSYTHKTVLVTVVQFCGIGCDYKCYYYVLHAINLNMPVKSMKWAQRNLNWRINTAHNAQSEKWCYHFFCRFSASSHLISSGLHSYIRIQKNIVIFIRQFSHFIFILHEQSSFILCMCRL